MPVRLQEPTEPTWRQVLRMLFWAAFAVFVIASCRTGRLPQQQPFANIGQDCGSVNVGSNGTIEHDPQPPENCLVAAFTHCQSARLTFGSSGIDTGEGHNLQVVPTAKGCQVEDRPTFSSAVARLNWSFSIPPVYDCESLQWVHDGVMVKGCQGEEDFVIPLYPAVIGHLCGHVNGMNGETQNDPGALRCFWQAYTHCQAATLIVHSPKIPIPPNDDDPPLQAIISVQPSYGACAVSLVERHIQGDFIPRTCAELINRRDQLVVSACGTLGDFAIPLTPNATPL